MGKTSKTITVILITLLLVFFFFSIYVTVDESMPGNATVIVTEEDKLFHSIHFDHICLEGKTAKTMPLLEARERGYQAHAHDEELGYFRGNRRFLFHDFLARAGIQVNSRWDENGNWLW
ncbi:MAG: hypothetical protein CVU57_16935 [Deltaproteobacteria bacterium HGW-Deltaproteobacteria-15]|nr:MAG: hypothetical protein CVU57_16935 [Deltaproteobacteria bacterium HGW-Deltaproteobacteria-15]